MLKYYKPGELLWIFLPLGDEQHQDLPLAPLQVCCREHWKYHNFGTWGSWRFLKLGANRTAWQCHWLQDRIDSPCFGVTKVKWLTIPLQNVVAEVEVLDQPALMCLPHQSALPEEDVAIHHQGNMNMQLVSYLFNT